MFSRKTARFLLRACWTLRTTHCWTVSIDVSSQIFALFVLDVYRYAIRLKWRDFTPKITLFLKQRCFKVILVWHLAQLFLSEKTQAATDNHLDIPFKSQIRPTWCNYLLKFSSFGWGRNLNNPCVRDRLCKITLFLLGSCFLFYL